MRTDPQTLLGLLTARGYSPAGSAGILGNLQTESSFDPAAVGDGGTSLGLAQWHADRKQGLIDYAKAQGLGVTDPAAQIGFLDKELHQPQYAGLLSQLQTETDPKAGATAFLGFERPKGWSADNPLGAMGAQSRIANAASIFGGSGSPSTPLSPASSAVPPVPESVPDADSPPAPITPQPDPMQSASGLLGALGGPPQQSQQPAANPLSLLQARRGPLSRGLRPIASILGSRA